MKFPILLFSLLFLGLNINAQTLNVVSTSPTNGEFGVDTDSVVITFDKPIHFDLEDPEDPGIFFTIQPDDSLDINGLSMSEDSLSIIVYVTLNDETDFTGILTHAEGVNGEYLDEPYYFQFSTRSDFGQFSVQGTLTHSELEKVSIPEDDAPIMVYLASESLNLFEDNNDDCIDEECEDDDINPIYLAFADPITGNYSINGVREGTYFPIAIGLYFGDEESEEGFFPEIYFYDPDSDLISDSIKVNTTTAPNDTLTGIDLARLEFNSITFSEALEIAQPIFDELENDPILLGGFTFYASLEYSEPHDSTAFKVPLFQNLAQKASAPENEEESNFFNFLSTAGGSQIEWSIIGYDAIKDSAFSIVTTPFGATFTEYVGPEEAELPDSIEFSSIKAIPENFIDSDSAAVIIANEGGADFIEYFGDEFGFWTMDLQALHSYWEFPPNPTISAPVMWKAEFFGLRYNPFEDEFENAYLLILIDIETGEVVHQESDESGFGQSSHITFQEATLLADSLLTSLPNNPVILGGTTSYNNYDIVVDDFEEKASRSFKSKVKSAMEDTSFTVHPDGNAYSWQVFAYDNVKDSVVVIGVTEFSTEIYGYMSEDSVEGNIDFSEMKLLTGSEIDSDSAAYLFDMAGGLDFRTNLEESELEWNWEMELQILHDYWDYPLDQTLSAPITWRADYYAWTWDFETEKMYEDSLIIYIDAVTGSVLHKTMTVSNENEGRLPEDFALMQNYPNPFNPSTNITFRLSKSSKVEINVYSILGQKVATLTNDLYSVGSHSITWNATGLSSGIYIYRMKAGGFTDTKKLLLLK